jgi:hypothetical protein
MPEDAPVTMTTAPSTTWRNRSSRSTRVTRTVDRTPTPGGTALQGIIATRIGVRVQVRVT